jgi:hypothetical protein
MNALALLTEAFEAGIKISAEGTRLVLEGEALTDAMVASFKAAKPEVLALLTAVPEGLPTIETSHSRGDSPRPESNVCDDCGRAAVVMVCTDYGAKFCRSCLRPEPTNTKPKTRGLQ